MKFGKLIILGTVLATCIPAAFADTIQTTGKTASSGITATGIQINGVITATGPHKNQAPGKVKGDTGSLFSAFSAGTTMYYTPPLISGNPAFHFIYGSSTTDAPTLAHPVHLYEIVSGSNILDLYLTNVDPTSIVKAATGAFGGFTATGYITLTGYASPIPITFTLQDDAKGAGSQNFTTTITGFAPVALAPEPNSLALLGTGMLSLAGIGYRKFRATV